MLKWRATLTQYSFVSPYWIMNCLTSYDIASYAQALDVDYLEPFLVAIDDNPTRKKKTNFLLLLKWYHQIQMFVTPLSVFLCSYASLIKSFIVLCSHKGWSHERHDTGALSVLSWNIFFLVLILLPPFLPLFKTAWWPRKSKQCSVVVKISPSFFTVNHNLETEPG